MSYSVCLFLPCNFLQKARNYVRFYVNLARDKAALNVWCGY